MNAPKEQKADPGQSASTDTETAHIIITSKAKSGSMSIASELPFKDDNDQVWQYSESYTTGTITEVSISCHGSAAATVVNDGDNAIITIPITDTKAQISINFTRADNPEQQLTPIIVKGGDDGSGFTSASGEQTVIPNVYIISGVPFSTPLNTDGTDDWHNSICQTAGYITQVTVTLSRPVTVTIEDRSSDLYIDVPVELGEVTIDISYNYTSDGETTKA